MGNIKKVSSKETAKNGGDSKVVKSMDSKPLFTRVSTEELKARRISVYPYLVR